MSNINRYFGPQNYSTNVNDLNAGLGLQRSDDFLSPRSINNFGTSFTQTVTPTKSRSPYILNNSDILSHNASSLEVLLKTNRASQAIMPAISNDPNTIVRLPELPYNYYQGVPDLGTDPNAIEILSASTQFQNDLVTEGVPAIPGYPQVGLGQNPQAQDYLGNTSAFISGMIPNQPGAAGQGAYFPGAQGGSYYPVPTIQPPYAYSQYSPTTYPQFAPYSGSNVTPAQIPYPVPGGYCPPVAYPPYCPPNFPQPCPQQPPLDTMSLVTEIRTNPFKLPDYIPQNSVGGVETFIQHFNNTSESDRVEVRRQMTNPTTVNQTVLNSTGITGKGGKFNQGIVTNPFATQDFITDTNPYQTTHSGLIVTNGNDNGKVKGTQVSDTLIGTQARNNIVDGMGGEDNIVTSSKKDLVNAHAGDRVFTDGDDDLVFYDFTKQPASGNDRVTVVDGGDGNDTMILTVDDPSKDDIPVFNKLVDGTISVAFNGVQILTRNIEKFISVDKNGNIGGTFKSL